MSGGAPLRGRDLALVVVIVATWALNFLTSARALQEIPPILFTALRFGLLALPSQWLQICDFSRLITKLLLERGFLLLLFCEFIDLPTNYHQPNDCKCHRRHTGAQKHFGQHWQSFRGAPINSFELTHHILTNFRKRD